VVELARWQFALTTLFHFIFVPLTLGLAPFLAIMQTRWYRTGSRERWPRSRGVAVITGKARWNRPEGALKCRHRCVAWGTRKRGWGSVARVRIVAPQRCRRKISVSEVDDLYVADTSVSAEPREGGGTVGPVPDRPRSAAPAPGRLNDMEGERPGCCA
jgi:hypothetical protein